MLSLLSIKSDPNKPLTKNQKKREAKKSKAQQDGQVGGGVKGLAKECKTRLSHKLLGPGWRSFKFRKFWPDGKRDDEKLEISLLIRGKKVALYKSF